MNKGNEDDPMELGDDNESITDQGISKKQRARETPRKTKKKEQQRSSNAIMTDESSVVDDDDDDDDSIVEMEDDGVNLTELFVSTW